MTSVSVLRKTLLTITITFCGLRAACLPDGVQQSGAKYRVCMPNGAWNRNLVVYAPGYVPAGQPVQIPEDQLVLSDGTSLPQLLNGLGFAFAVSSFSTNGLAVKQGVSDLADLVSLFDTVSPQGPANKVYIFGPSQGGLITAISLEKFPNLYNGGVAACGPIGGHQAEVNYLGNFWVLFDYFFPGVVPSSPEVVPVEVLLTWFPQYVPKIQAAVAANSSATTQLLRVSGAAVNPLDPTTRVKTVVDLMSYIVFSINDSRLKLGGRAFDNRTTVYSGSSNDAKLNREIKRYTPDAAATNEIKAHYETSGLLIDPLVTLHTLYDPIVPFWHEQRYLAKTVSQGTSRLFLNIPVLRYSHCRFNAVEALLAFGLLLVKDAGNASFSSSVEDLLPADQRLEFRIRAAAEGLRLTR